MAGTGVPCWLSITAAGDRTRAGEPAYAAFALAAEVPEVVAVGVNCLDPDDVPGLLALAAAASGKPGVAYPNRGEGWDADAKTWTGPGAFDPADGPAGWPPAPAWSAAAAGSRRPTSPPWRPRSAQLADPLPLVLGQRSGRLGGEISASSVRFFTPSTTVATPGTLSA